MLLCIITIYGMHSLNKNYTVKLVLRGQLWDKENVALQDSWPLKWGSTHVKFSMSGHENDDLLIQVTA